MSRSLAAFVQTLQSAPVFVERLEMFRIETLARLDPVDKKKQTAANAAMDELLLESTVGVDNFVIPDMLIPNTKSAVYVFLNASVCHREMLTAKRPKVRMLTPLCSLRDVR
jgi:mediator of RNA polymerase II transcription subunit 5